ncbi:Neuropeptide-Like Protein [Caenorhabditis elegans]|uniref:Neuropeptide-Like Protein n=1 Tax=Caenorhabditis elegans TaxID=6239 RepID=Q19078_CAEEL|nr:Neuropeptide-Like Protein [Caenorhabditis elegans]CCD66333.1 Neuropeptide-Like Protein [Caenorhabditis elegans]|eukprot:NP_508876.1 Uncharacterized protein CELE_EGAP5.1 [Caenorhabditis elegans]
MSPNMFGLVFFLIVAVAQASLFLDENSRVMAQPESVGSYVTDLDKLKRSFGRNCMLAISGCFTSSQAERYRKYMDNVRFIPK